MKAAIFDADGTLIDSMHVWDGIGEKYLKSLGVEPEADIDKIIADMSFADSCAYMIKTYGIKKSVPQMIKEISERVADEYRFEIPLKAGVYDYLKKLEGEGVKICVLTASERGYITECFERLGIMPFISFIMTCSEESLDKNSPQVFHRAANRLGVNREDITVFEDSFNAIASAKKGDYRVCAVYDDSAEKYKNEIRKISDIYIKDFRELL